MPETPSPTPIDAQINSNVTINHSPLSSPQENNLFLNQGVKAMEAVLKRQPYFLLERFKRDPSMTAELSAVLIGIKPATRNNAQVSENFMAALETIDDPALRAFVSEFDIISPEEISETRSSNMKNSFFYRKSALLELATQCPEYFEGINTYEGARQRFIEIMSNPLDITEMSAEDRIRLQTVAGTFLGYPKEDAADFSRFKGAEIDVLDILLGDKHNYPHDEEGILKRLGFSEEDIKIAKNFKRAILRLDLAHPYFLFHPQAIFKKARDEFEKLLDRLDHAPIPAEILEVYSENTLYYWKVMDQAFRIDASGIHMDPEYRNLLLNTGRWSDKWQIIPFAGRYDRIDTLKRIQNVEREFLHSGMRKLLKQHGLLKNR